MAGWRSQGLRGVADCRLISFRLCSGWDIYLLYVVNVVGRVILLYSGLSAHYAILYTLFDRGNAGFRYSLVSLETLRCPNGTGGAPHRQRSMGAYDMGTLLSTPISTSH